MAPAGFNTAAYKRAEAQVYAEETACWLCGGSRFDPRGGRRSMARSIDHVIPRSRGGTHERSNMRLAHFGCNARRQARLLSVKAMGPAHRGPDPHSRDWWGAA